MAGGDIGSTKLLHVEKTALYFSAKIFTSKEGGIGRRRIHAALASSQEKLKGSILNEFAAMILDMQIIVVQIRRLFRPVPAS
ncbi:MAG: hypothetical protein ACC700_15865 [Anaerolineales bacterium]